MKQSCRTAERISGAGQVLISPHVRRDYGDAYTFPDSMANIVFQDADL
jgi:hypothetical protein